MGVMGLTAEPMTPLSHDLPRRLPCISRLHIPESLSAVTIYDERFSAFCQIWTIFRKICNS
jgi:hypothetical protein